MSKLEKLIQQYCPDGVEWKPLGEVCDSLNKGTLTTSKLVKSNGHNYPVINSGRELYGYYSKYNNEGDALTIAARGEYAGFVSYFSERFWAGGLCYPYRANTPTVSTKYLYYYLKSKQEYIRHCLVAEGGIPALNKSIIEMFEIPVPPLPVQEEIVRILDAFSELQAELQAELQKRKQQYNFYRDNLLNFKDINRREQEIKWMKISDICNSVCSGRNRIKKPNGVYPVFGSTGIISYCDKYAFDKTQILVARVGANAGYVQIANNKYDVSDNTLIIDLRNDIELSLKYVYYTLICINLNKYAKGGGQPLITAGELKRISIPIPPIEEQNRIVSILDRFDTLTTDLTQGLPAEMEKRRQQYEFYRDKLLTFKRKEA